MTQRAREREPAVTPSPRAARDRRDESLQAQFSTLLRLQRSVGNTAVSRLLQREAAEAPAAAGRDYVCWGSSGPDVMYLQSRLNLASEVTTLLAVDGKFGPATYKAVKQFQRAHKPLKVDGIVGSRTWPAPVRAVPDEPVDKTAMAKKVFDAGKEHHGGSLWARVRTSSRARVNCWTSRCSSTTGHRR